MSEQTPKSRLSLVAAAAVIARRDFTAILFSRVFFFFLLGPLFPIIVGALAGGIGSSLDSSAGEPEIAVAMSASDEARLFAAHKALRAQLGPAMPQIREVAQVPEGETYDARALLARRDSNIAAVLSGTLEHPVLTAPKAAWPRSAAASRCSRPLRWASRPRPSPRSPHRSSRPAAPRQSELVSPLRRPGRPCCSC